MNPRKVGHVPETLYRFFDGDGQLLYVGITADVGTRLGQHEADKPWWTEAVTVTLEHHATRAEVAAAELVAIRREGPKYNVASHPRRDQRMAHVAERLQQYAGEFGFLPPGDEMNVWIEAETAQRLVSTCGSEAAAQRLGCSERWVRQRLALFKMPDEELALVFSGQVPVWRARQYKRRR